MISRPLIFSAALLSLTAPTLACDSDEATLFSCPAEDKAHVIELCAVRDDAAGGFQTLQYHYGTADKQELTFPDNRRDGKAQMSFAHAYDKDSYVWALRFGNAGYTYRVFGLGEKAGVEVWKGKKRLAQVMCGEKPYGNPDDLRRASSCDMDNPFGKDGCNAAPPRRN